MENKNQEIKKETIENNNILIDLLLKANKITTALSLMIDTNNIKGLEKPIMDPIFYGVIQDKVIEIVEALNKNYVNLMEEINNGK